MKFFCISFSYCVNVINSNFEKIIDKAKGTIKTWYNRSLTIYSRILLVKLLINSLLQYVGQVFVIPSKVLQEIEQIAWKFVCKGKKRSKIKKLVLYKNYNDGGLRMIDIMSSQKCQKIMWLKRYLTDNNSIWALVANTFCSVHEGLELLARCNYDVKRLANTIPLYYEKMLEYWGEIRIKTPVDDFIWNNRNITVDNAIVFYRQIFNNGLWYISDLFEKDVLLSFNVGILRGVLCKNIMQWIQIVDNVTKKNLLGSVMEKRGLNFYFNGKICNLCNVDSKKIYNKINSLLTQNVYSKNQCNLPLQLNLDSNDWSLIFSSKYSVNKCVAEFQYKLFHGAIYLNTQLSKCHTVNTNLCTFCNGEIETYEHLFYECKIVKCLWKEVCNFFDCDDVLQKLMWKNFLLGDFNSEFDSDVNILIPYVKYYIYICKCKNEVPKVTNLISMLKKESSVNAYCAINNNKYEMFLDNWDKIINSL